MSRVLMLDQDKSTGGGTPQPRPAVAAIAIVVGCALTAAAAVDIALLWFPLNFGSVDWEFGTISSTFDSLPLVTIGLTALLVGVLYRPASWPTYATAAVFFGMMLFCLGASVLYLLTLPTIIQAAPAVVAASLRTAVAKTLLLQVVYTLLYAWLGWFALRTARARKQA